MSKEIKPICRNCRYWGDGDGTGMPYDAGHMNNCRNKQISGDQHPSYGVGGETKTMVYSNYWRRDSNTYAGTEKQIIETRWSFGCNLFEQNNVQD